MSEDTPSWPMCTLMAADGSPVRTDAVEADHRYGPSADGTVEHVAGWHPDIPVAGVWRGNMADLYSLDLGVGNASGHPEGTPDAA